ncbi:hypothetical protein R3P38DRAFT_1469518 [Favolaschia claudopus]|uniref:Uncharacterized protein n=1 Tax=Favolaschia claudopus TaxID=2862362 RepID=A0AAW0DS38_9AGAR
MWGVLAPASFESGWVKSLMQQACERGLHGLHPSPYPSFLLSVVLNFGRYIETQDQGGEIIVRPWVWIALIFVGPIIGAIVFVGLPRRPLVGNPHSPRRRRIDAQRCCFPMAFAGCQVPNGLADSETAEKSQSSISGDAGDAMGWP